MLAVTCAKPVSWYWQGFILFALATALVGIGFCAVRHAYPWWLGSLLALWLIYYTYQGLALLCWRRKSRAITALLLHSATDVELFCRNGESYRGQLCPGGLVLAPLAIFQVKSVAFKTRVLLEARHMVAADYHALARMVRDTA
jgi:hypothetical protein